MIISPIHKNLLTTVIAPHGITDMIHAAQYNTTTELLAYQGVSLATSLVLSKHIPIVLDDAFIIASITHFRHDMGNPEIFRVPKYVMSAALLFASIHFDPNILYSYMVLIHVPNHYKTNWKYIKSSPQKNIGGIILFSLLLFGLGEFYPSLFESKEIFAMSKGIVISHVLYNELYIDDYSDKYSG